MKQIPKEQVVARVQTENPWWIEDHFSINNFEELTPRPYLNLLFPLIRATDVRRAIILMGSRRVGKTVIIHHAINKLLQEGIPRKNICYISVDHPLYNGLSLEEILQAYREAANTSTNSGQIYVFFDEIQYLKNWEIHLKTLVDESPTIKFIASGSAAAALKLKSNESGAGRFTNFMLPPLSFHEYLVLKGKTHLVQIAKSEQGIIEEWAATDIKKLNAHFLNYLNFGGYPEVAFSPTIQKDPHRFIKSDIIDKVLLRDLPSLYGVQDVQELNYLFTTLAFNSADEVSLEQLSRGSGVAKNTIKKYIEYLEAAFLLRTIHRVDRNAKRFKRANFFKVYLTNPSIRSALFTLIKEDDPAMGSLVETAIFSQWFHSEMPLYYARWNSGEVDMVCLGPQQKVDWAIEVKWSDRYFKKPKELKSLIKFCHTQNLQTAKVTTRTQSGSKTIENVTLEFIPASLYCYILGHNIVKTRSNEFKNPNDTTTG